MLHTAFTRIYPQTVDELNSAVVAALLEGNKILLCENVHNGGISTWPCVTGARKRSTINQYFGGFSARFSNSNYYVVVETDLKKCLFYIRKEIY